MRRYLQAWREEVITTVPAVARSLAFVQRNIVALMVLLSVMSYFDRTIMSIAGPGMIHDFGLSETQMGSVYSAFLLGYALMMMPGGRLADRWGPWRTLMGMGCGAALFTGLTALGARPGLGSWIGIVSAFLLIRFALGVCTAPIYPACGRMIANWFPAARQGLVWGLVAGGAGVGSAISPTLFAWMIPRYGWRVSFWLAGAATALLAFLWAWYARDRPAEHPSLHALEIAAGIQANPSSSAGRSLPSWRQVLANRNVMLLAAGYSTVGYFEYIFFFWIYYYFGQIRHMTPNETSIYTATIFIAWVVMTPCGGWVSDRLVKELGARRGRGIVPAVAMLLAALLLLLGTRLSSPPALGVTLALSFGLASCSDGPYWAATIDAGSKNVGAACGILNTGSNLGGFIAPVLTPFIASLAGWSAALYFGCVVALIGVGIWLFVGPSVAETVPRK